jgi:hypothetical protein
VTNTGDGDLDIGTSAQGKRWEFFTFGRLLEKGYSVFIPAVDNEGIDCLVDVGHGRYKEVQVKSSARGTFIVRNFEARDGYYIVCVLAGPHSQQPEEVWVIPSKLFGKLGHSTKDGGAQLAIGKPLSANYETLREHRDNFDHLLKGASEEVKSAVHQASKRVEGPHLKRADYEREVLELLSSDPAAGMPTRVIITNLEHRMRDRFSKADLEPTKGTKGKSNRKRWEVTARFAIYQGLKKKGLISSDGKSGWIITLKGRASIGKDLVEFLNR